MTKCRGCDSDVPDGARYCPACGNSLAGKQILTLDRGFISAVRRTRWKWGFLAGIVITLVPSLILRFIPLALPEYLLMGIGGIAFLGMVLLLLSMAVILVLYHLRPDWPKDEQRNS
jgi:hypothetical protein